MDGHGRWAKKVQEGDIEYTVDLVETFSTIWACVKWLRNIFIWGLAGVVGHEGFFRLFIVWNATVM